MKLFFDIETIPSRKLSSETIEVKVPANYKNPEVIEKYTRENQEAEYRKAALSGLTGEIFSIAFQCNNSAIWCAAQSDFDGSEEDLLIEFFQVFDDWRKELSRAGQGDYQQVEWIGFNAIEFDLRFLKQRAWVNRVRPCFIPADAKHGGGHVFDIMKEWAGWKGYVSQTALCNAFGLQFDDEDGIDGSQVYDLYKAGDYETIKKYNKLDVQKVRALYDLLTWSS